jgi:L-2-amino-thiazoline-4-carboxylic acid hydrolase
MLVHSTVLVSDDAIRQAQNVLWQALRVVAEPGGAAALSALLSGAYKPKSGERVAAVRRSSVEQAAEFAAKAGGKTSMQTFIDRQALWKAGDALTVEVKEQTEQSYVYNVTRCRYAEMYREMGLGEIGHLLSCQRDATFCEGYDKRLKLTRTQTLMQGASHCDFNYKYEDEPG